MNLNQDRRKSPRKTLEPPEVGLMFYDYEGGAGTGEHHVAEYVDLYNRSKEGMLLRTTRHLKAQAPVYLNVYDAWAKAWVMIKGEVRWSERVPDKVSYWRAGIFFNNEETNVEIPWEDILFSNGMPFPSDYEFFRKTKMLRFISGDVVSPLLNAITRVVAKPGDRLIAQGEEGNKFYVIQDGSCTISVEKSGVITPICRRGPGDILGEMSLLTGKPTSAHVDAETRMVRGG